MLTSVVAAFLYLRIMVSTWIEPTGRRGHVGSRSGCRSATGLAITASVGFTLVVGFFPNWLLDAAEVTNQFAR